MKHIGIFNTSGDVQTAIANEALLNPYVALVSGVLDYNSIVPTPVPTTMGTWTGKSFQITETGTTYWEQPVKIGVLNDVFMDGNQDSPDVMLTYLVLVDTWHMEFASDIASDQTMHDFIALDTWETSVMTVPDESTSAIHVEFDGTDTFTFDIADGFLATINPEYPEAGE